MNIYEINKEILSCVDEETGEIIDEDRLNMLQIVKEEKMENIALWIKNLKAEADAIKKEEENLYNRRKTIENKQESLKNYLKFALKGQKLETSKVKVSYRNTKAVNIVDEQLFVQWAEKNNKDDLLNYKEPTISKTAVKEEIEKGALIPYATIEEKQAIIIK